MQVRPERVQPELERRRDAEIPAGPAEAPEELGLLRCACPDDPAVGGDELDRSEVVDRQAEVPLEPADAATEGEPGDAGVTDDADRADEPVRLRRDVELAEERPAVRSGGPPLRIDSHAPHPRQVHHEAAVATGMTRAAVAAGSDGELEVLAAGEPDRPSRPGRSSSGGR